MAQLFENDVLICAATAWLIAQVLKTLINWRLTHSFSLRRMIGMGGMPSSHTAFLIAMTSMVAYREGLGSTFFALAFALTVVVVYDAMGVRYQTGKQSHVINKILHQMLVEGQPLTDETLLELVGHTPTEVFFGGIIGLLVQLAFR